MVSTIAAEPSCDARLPRSAAETLRRPRGRRRDRARAAATNTAVDRCLTNWVANADPQRGLFFPGGLHTNSQASSSPQLSPWYFVGQSLVRRTGVSGVGADIKTSLHAPYL